MAHIEENCKKAIKIYKSCFNKFINILPWTEPIPDRIYIAIDILKQAILDCKVKKDIHNQIKYLFLIDEYYDKLYEYTKDRNLLKNHGNIIKDLIIVCNKNKNNKINFINNLELPYDIYNLLNKYIILSEEYGDNYTILTCYKFILDFYKNPESDKQIQLLFDIYEKKRNITEEYDESYGDLIINKKEDYV